MITDKKLGLKVAENPEEAFWEELRIKNEKMIAECRHEIIIQANMVELCKKHLKASK